MTAIRLPACADFRSAGIRPQVAEPAGTIRALGFVGDSCAQPDWRVGRARAYPQVRGRFGVIRRCAPGRIRTCDARFRKPTLYPLSYGGLDSTDHSLPTPVSTLLRHRQPYWQTEQSGDLPQARTRRPRVVSQGPGVAPPDGHPVATSAPTSDDVFQALERGGSRELVRPDSRGGTSGVSRACSRTSTAPPIPDVAFRSQAMHGGCCKAPNAT